jgi:hypothetical protein
MSPASDENESRAQGDLRVVYNIRTVSPDQPGYEALHARQIRALGLVLRRLAMARRPKESQEKPAQKGLNPCPEFPSVLRVQNPLRTLEEVHISSDFRDLSFLYEVGFESATR